MSEQPEELPCHRCGGITTRASGYECGCEYVPPPLALDGLMAAAAHVDNRAAVVMFDTPEQAAAFVRSLRGHIKEKR